MGTPFTNHPIAINHKQQNQNHLLLLYTRSRAPNRMYYRVGEKWEKYCNNYVVLYTRHTSQFHLLNEKFQQKCFKLYHIFGIRKPK